MYGALERVSVVVTEVLCTSPVIGFLVANVALADLVEYWLTQHGVVAHIIHRSCLHAQRGQRS